MDEVEQEKIMHYLSVNLEITMKEAKLILEVGAYLYISLPFLYTPTSFAMTIVENKQLLERMNNG